MSWSKWNENTYSYSRLETFKQCKRKFAFQYIEKPDVERKQSVEAYLGTMCHEAIQQLYKDLNLSRLMSLEEMLAFYDKEWEVKKPEHLRIVRERYTEKDYKETGVRYLKGFYRSQKPFKDGNTLGIEKEVIINLAGNGLRIIGYIDRLVDHGRGHYEIIDYKTDKELPSVADIETKWQLPIYHLGLLQMFPGIKKVTCTWHYLPHNKKLSIQRMPLDLETLKINVIELIDKILATTEFDPTPSALCSWCDYEALCPARKHLIEVAALEGEAFKHEDGVFLVDEYMKNQKILDQANKKKSELEKRIYDYAFKKGLLVVRGSYDKLRVWSKDKAIRFIGKAESAQKYNEIVAILKKHNLWEKYSNLASFSLSKAIDNKEIPPVVVKELQPYMKFESIFRLYPSKFK